MLKKICFFILILFAMPIFAEEEPEGFNPKFFGYVEGGERWIEEDNDYSTDDYNNESYYKYTLRKIGISQKLSNTSFFSLSYKTNEKDFQNENDSGLNNITKTIAAYVRFNLVDNLQFKVEANYRISDFELRDSDFKDNDWADGAISFIYHNKKKPDKNYFFNSEKNRYLLKFGYKRQLYEHESVKNSNTSTVLFHWDYHHSKKLTLNSKVRIFNRDYEQTGKTRKNSTKNSYQLGFEYQF